MNFRRVLALEREGDERLPWAGRVALHGRTSSQFRFLQAFLEIRIVVDRFLKLDDLLARSLGRVLGIDGQ